MPEIVLTKEQQAVIDNRGGTLLVSAAAGSGKTKVLIDRLLKYVNEGANVDDFLLITFTQAAAAELRGKMVARLNELLAERPDDRHLQKQMNRVYLAKISTVHSFCGSLLREYAHMLDLPADFRTAEDSETDLLKNNAMQTMLEEIYRTRQNDESIAQALDMLGAGRDDRALPGLILKVYESVQCWRDPKKRLQDLRDSTHVGACDDPVQTLWGEYLMQELKKSLQEYESSIRYAISLIQTNETLQPYLQTFAADLEIIRNLSAANTWEEISKISWKFATIKQVRKCDCPELKVRVKAIRDSIKEDLYAKLKNFVIPREQLLQDLGATATAINGLLTMVLEFDSEYSEQKLRRHLLDYNDLEHQTLRLLLSANDRPTSAAKEIAERFREIMVDEYQDTNGVQDAIFGALAYRGNLFMVGDVKQSIYRFRMADPTGFLNRYKTYADYTVAAENEPRKILLSDNFRSCPEVLSAANDVFRLLMTPSVGGLKYGDAEALRANLPDHGGMPVELHCIDLQDVSKDLHLASEEIEAEFIARRIRKMLDEGETITLREGTRQIAPEDITILMRGVKSSAPTYISVLARHGIRCLCGSENLLETQEIGTLVSLLKIIDNPYQDIPLVSVLFSPLFCFTADDLAKLRACDRTSDLYDILKNSETGAKALDTISYLRDISARCNLHTLLDEIEEKLYVREVFPNCEYNFDKFLEMADRYEASDRYGLSGFLRYLEIQKEKGVSSEQPSQRGAVRLMTMHKSKGLEFPVVFLAGLKKRFNDQDMHDNVLVDAKLGIGCKRTDPKRSIVFSTIARDAIADRMKKESRSEEMRVLYVAMTRAKCRLIMTYCAKGLAKKLGNIATEMTVPPLESYVSGVGSLGDWILMAAMTRTEAGELYRVSGEPFESNVSQYPWRITFHEGENYLPQEEKTQSEEMTAQELLTLNKANYGHLSACAFPSKLTATQLKGRTVDEELSQARNPILKFVKPSFDKETTLSATQRGTAMHLAMQYLRYDACLDEAGIEKELERLVEQAYMTKEQADAVSVTQILAFFRSELGNRVLSAQNLLREFKFSLLNRAEEYEKTLSGEEILLQGVADCCLIEEDGLVVIDFKSDRIKNGEESERTEHYRGQIAAYADALARIFEMPVKESILYFFATGQSVTVK